MTQADATQLCKTFITELAARDAFIGGVDQRLAIEGEVTEICEAIDRLEKDLASRFERLMDETKAEFSKLTEAIEQAKTGITEVFQRLQSSPRNAQINIQCSVALAQHVHSLSRRVRPRMLRAIDKLSPRYKILEKPLNELPNFHSHLAKPLADKIGILIDKRDPNAALEGKSIFELEYLPLLERLCKPAFLSSFRYSLHRIRCARRYRMLQLPFKSLCIYYLSVQSTLNIDQLLQRHNNTHVELQNQLADAWRALRYNLETASTELEDLHANIRSELLDGIDEKHEELKSLVMNAIGKSLETLDDVSVIYASFLDAAIAQITQAHEHSIQSLREVLSHPREIRGRFLRKVNSKVYKRPGLTQSGKRAPPKLTQLIQPSNIWQASRPLWSIMPLLRHKQAVEESLLQLSDLPTQLELVDQAKSLPPIYRRMFHNEPLINREFLVGMDDELNQLDDAYTRWSSGKVATAAIIGPEGSGKTSLINCFENDIESDIKVLRHELRSRLRNGQDVLRLIEDIFELNEHHESADALIHTLNELDRRAVIIEGGHYLLLRVIGARESIDTFLHILISTRATLFWLISFRLNPWRRMCYMYHIERYFTHVINSEFHNPDELTQALLVRQRATGQSPTYTSEGINSFRINKLLSKYKPQDPLVQSALAELHFSTLYDFSGGNMATALYYWLQSLRIDEHGTIVINPTGKVDMSFIKKLDQNYLFTLAEVLIHGALTVKEHSELFGLETNRSRLALEYLRQIRLLQSVDSDRYDQPLYYSINTLFFQPVTATLRDMHILY